MKEIFFEKYAVKGEGTHVRSLYEQADGTKILADHCTCFADFSKPGPITRFTVTRDRDCVIDEHRVLL